MRGSLQSEFRQYMDSGETLLWSGKPKSGIQFTGKDIFLTLFGLFWLGFSVFWTIMATSMGGGYFGLFGIPFIIIGVFLVFGRFIYDAIRRKHTSYGMTQDRILIKAGIFSKTVYSHVINSLTNISFTEKSDGSGSIALKDMPISYSKNSKNRSDIFMRQQYTLDHIKNVRSVYSKIMDIQQSESSYGSYN